MYCRDCGHKLKRMDIFNHGDIVTRNYKCVTCGTYVMTTEKAEVYDDILLRALRRDKYKAAHPPVKKPKKPAKTSKERYQDRKLKMIQQMIGGAK